MAKSALSNAGPDSRPGREKCLDVDAGSPGSSQAAGARQCALNQSEEELLACLGEGLLYKEIEERLHLSHTALRKR
jgi:DNA-binding NarL/FixJ family response regulator